MDQAVVSPVSKSSAKRPTVTGARGRGHGHRRRPVVAGPHIVEDLASAHLGQPRRSRDAVVGEAVVHRLVEEELDVVVARGLVVERGLDGQLAGRPTGGIGTV